MKERKDYRDMKKSGKSAMQEVGSENIMDTLQK